MRDLKVWRTVDKGRVMIVSMTSALLDESDELLVEHYFSSEPLAQQSGMHKNVEAMKEMFNVFIEIAKDGLSLCAIDKKTQKLVGVGFVNMEVESEMDKYFKEANEFCKQKESKDFVAMEEKAWGNFNPFKHMKVKCYIELDFVTVAESHRKRGIYKSLTDVSKLMAKRMARGQDVRYPLEGKLLKPFCPPGALMVVCTHTVSSDVCLKAGFHIIKSVPHKLLFGRYPGITENSNESLLFLAMPLQTNDPDTSPSFGLA